MRPLLAFGLLAALCAPASALSPEAASYLKKIGIDLRSEAVRVADQDGTVKTVYQKDAVEYSLESLVAQNRRNGVANFVTTRAFIRRLKADFEGTAIPKAHYDGLYLTPQERALVGRKLIENLGR